MKNTFRFLTAFVLISQLAFSQSIPQKIDSIIKQSFEVNPEVGISLGFIQNDQEYYTAYGKMSKESQIDINKNSVFEIASITKILTSNLIAQAVIGDKLNLDDYIDSYLPKAYVLNTGLKNKIKISDLGSHQSGLPDIDFRKLIEQNPQQPVSSLTQESLTEIVNTATELSDYGTYRYSTIGYTLLGQILENVYEKSYDEIIREKMINPLQMTNTFTKDFDIINLTAGYSPEGGSQEAFKWNITAPAGLIKSNASDMVTYLKSLLDEQTLIGKAATLADEVIYKDERREIGLGTTVITDEANTIYFKTGDSMGHSSIICYNKTKNWGIIILLNQRNSKMRQVLLGEIYEKVLK